jgi:hypothetical protein
MTRSRPGHICSDDYLVAVTYPIFATRDALTIDAGSGPQLRHCLDNQRKASGQVVSGPKIDAERIRSAIARLTSNSIEGLEGLSSELRDLRAFLHSEVQRVEGEIDSALAGIKIIIETLEPLRNRPDFSLQGRTDTHVSRRPGRQLYAAR